MENWTEHAVRITLCYIKQLYTVCNLVTSIRHLTIILFLIPPFMIYDRDQKGGHITTIRLLLRALGLLLLHFLTWSNSRHASLRNIKSIWHFMRLLSRLTRQLPKEFTIALEDMIQCLLFKSQQITLVQGLSQLRKCQDFSESQTFILSNK